MRKIGMCCFCGDQLPKSQTVLFRGNELCRHCAEQAGYDEDDEEEPACDQCGKNQCICLNAE